MKKIAATLLSFMLMVSMVFAAAPMAFASELPSSDTTIATSTPASEAAASPAQTPAEEPVGTADDQDQLTPAEPDPSNTATTESPATDTADLAATLSSAAQTQSVLEPTSLGALSYWEKLKALRELNEALNDLYKTIYTASGPSVVRADSGYLNENNPSAHFIEGVYYSKVVTLINRINTLLEKCDLPSGLYVHALPIVVVGELPEGFVFNNNTLTLTNLELLKWNADLDEEGAVTRSYEIQLQLTTGINYIDAWLAGKGQSGLASATFVIELELLKDRDDPGPADPDPDKPDPPAPGPDIDEGDGTESTVVPVAAPVASSATPAASTTTEETTPDPVAPETASDSTDSTAAIEEQQIPMASMMVGGESNTLAANAVLVTLTLVLSALSLGSLRQQKIGVPPAEGSGGSLQRTSFVMGIAGVGFGAMSATLFVASQYLVTDPTSSSISWTPIFVTLGVVQAACLIAVKASGRIEAKRKDPRRFRVRY